MSTTVTKIVITNQIVRDHPVHGVVMLTWEESLALFERDKAILLQEIKDNQKAAAKRPSWRQPWELGAYSRWK